MLRRMSPGRVKGLSWAWLSMKSSVSTAEPSSSSARAATASATSVHAPRRRTRLSDPTGPASPHPPDPKICTGPGCHGEEEGEGGDGEEEGPQAATRVDGGDEDEDADDAVGEEGPQAHFDHPQRGPPAHPDEAVDRWREGRGGRWTCIGRRCVWHR